MDAKQILAELKAKKYQPVYFLTGDEPYYIDQISDYIEKNVLDEGGKAFNQVVHYGKEIDFKNVVDDARQFPMMAPYRVIIVKEAQEMKSLNNLQSYIENPSPQTILVINFKHKKFDGRSSFAKKVKAKAVFLESKKLYDNQLPAYIEKLVKAKGLKIEPKAISLLAEYIGTDLSNMNNEVNKLALRLEKGGLINSQLIQDFVGISKDYNIFELQNALGKRDVEKAFRIVNYFAANEKKNPLIVSISSLYGYFTKVWLTQAMSTMDDRSLASKIGVFSAFFMKDYRLAAKNYRPQKIKQNLLVLQEYDGYSKGVERRNPQQGELLKELVFKLLN